MANEATVQEQTTNTHIVISKQTKEVMDEVRKNSGILYTVIAEKAMRHGLKVIFKNYLSEETLEQLNNNS